MVTASRASHRQTISVLTSAAPAPISHRSRAVTVRMSPKRKAARSIRTPCRRDTTTNPIASAECASTPNVVSIAQPLPASVATAPAITSAVASVPAKTETSKASASATPSTAACAVASPK